MIAFFADKVDGQVIFHVARSLRDKMHEWEVTQDWEVFDEQLLVANAPARWRNRAHCRSHFTPALAAASGSMALRAFVAA